MAVLINHHRFTRLGYIVAITTAINFTIPIIDANLCKLRHPVHDKGVKFVSWIWQAGGVEQGPLYTAQSSTGVISTGIYEGLNYSWEIRTSNLEQSNQVFQALRFRAKSTFGG